MTERLLSKFFKDRTLATLNSGEGQARRWWFVPTGRSEGTWSDPRRCCRAGRRGEWAASTIPLAHPQNQNALNSMHLSCMALQRTFQTSGERTKRKRKKACFSPLTPISRSGGGDRRQVEIKPQPHQHSRDSQRTAANRAGPPRPEVKARSLGLERSLLACDRFVGINSNRVPLFERW